MGKRGKEAQAASEQASEPASPVRDLSPSAQGSTKSKRRLRRASITGYIAGKFRGLKDNRDAPDPADDAPSEEASPAGILMRTRSSVEALPPAAASAAGEGKATLARRKSFADIVQRLTRKMSKREEAPSLASIREEKRTRPLPCLNGLYSQRDSAPNLSSAQSPSAQSSSAARGSTDGGRAALGAESGEQGQSSRPASVPLTKRLLSRAKSSIDFGESASHSQKGLQTAASLAEPSKTALDSRLAAHERAMGHPKESTHEEQQAIPDMAKGANCNRSDARQPGASPSLSEDAYSKARTLTVTKCVLVDEAGSRDRIGGATGEDDRLFQGSLVVTNDHLIFTSAAFPADLSFRLAYEDIVSIVKQPYRRGGTTNIPAMAVVTRTRIVRLINFAIFAQSFEIISKALLYHRNHKSKHLPTRHAYPPCNCVDHRGTLIADVTLPATRPLSLLTLLFGSASLQPAALSLLVEGQGERHLDRGSHAIPPLIAVHLEGLANGTVVTDRGMWSESSVADGVIKSRTMSVRAPSILSVHYRNPHDGQRASEATPPEATSQQAGCEEPMMHIDLHHCILLESPDRIVVESAVMIRQEALHMGHQSRIKWSLRTLGGHPTATRMVICLRTPAATLLHESCEEDGILTEYLLELFSGVTTRAKEVVTAVSCRPGLVPSCTAASPPKAAIAASSSPAGTIWDTAVQVAKEAIYYYAAPAAARALSLERRISLASLVTAAVCAALALWCILLSPTGYIYDLFI